MSFDTFIDQAWDDHADDPAAVADRIAAQATALLTEPAQVPRLANLAHHVWGQHLGLWSPGIAFQQGLAESAHTRADANNVATVERYIHSLGLAGGLSDARPGMAPSERVRITALAAVSLAEHNSARSTALMIEAEQDADHAGLPDTDPAIRTLAVSCNNLAVTLQDLPQRSAGQALLMVQAAQAARRHWARAGTWLEVERAEYRLSHCHRVAGDATQAAAHAQGCLRIVTENNAPPLEHFFGWEAAALAADALAALDLADTADRAKALAARQSMHHWFGQLASDDQAWCRATLDRVALIPLTAPTPSTPPSTTPS